MADQNITIKLTVDGTGTLKKATSDVDKLNKATDKSTTSKKKTAKASETVIKGNKGVAQTNLSSAKGFSKMNQMLDGGGGSSGLVAAYATLAANVFAATAAFNAFRGAAAFEQLGEGFTFMANQAGRTMDLVVERLKEVTGEALSTEQALQGASLAISAGFSTEDLDQLAKVARGASLALGRNLADAFDRLTRGAIKLEPEILDELGIMVRLDDATEAYAATIGKTANQLTQFQRQQAFINAINEQGIEKYGELADAVDVNPYDKLAAAFGDLTKAGLSVLNVVLVPFANLFASSSTAMIGGLVLFGSTIITTMIPALGNMAKKAAEAAEGAEKFAKANLEAVDADIVGAEQSLAAGKKRTKTVKDLQKVVKEGGDVRAQALKTERNLNKQLDRAKDKSKALEKTGTAAQKAAAAERIAQIEAEIIATQSLGTAEKSRLGQKVVAESAAAAATQARIISDATAEISQVGVIQGFRVASAALKEYIATQVVATGTTGFFATALAWLAAKLKITTTAVKLYGTALLTAMPILAGIAIAVGVVMTVIGAIGNRFRDESDATRTLSTVTEELDGKFDQLNTTIAKLGDTASAGDIRIRQLKMSAGVFLEIAAGIKQITHEQDVAADALAKRLDNPNFAESMAGSPILPYETREGATARVRQGAIDKAFPELKKTLKEVATDTSLASKVLRDELAKELDNAFGRSEGSTTSANLADIVASLKPKDFEKVATAIRAAKDSTGEYDSQLTSLKKGLMETEQEFSKFFQGISQTTKFDGIVKAFDTMNTSIVALKGQPEALEASFDKMGSQLQKFRKRTFDEEGKLISEESIADFIKRVPKLLKRFKRIQQGTRTLQVDLKKLNNEAAALKTLASFSGSGTEALLNKQNEAIDKQIEINDLEREELEKINKPSAEVLQKIEKLKTDSLALSIKKKSEEQIALEGLVTELKMKEKLLGLENAITKSQRTQRENEAKVRRLMTGGSSSLTPIKENTLRIQAAKEEFEFAKKKADIEQDMIIAKAKLFMAEQDALLEQGLISKELHEETLEAAGEVTALQIKGSVAQAEAAESTKKLAIAQGLASGDLLTIAQSFKTLTEEGEKMAGVGLLVAAAFTPMIESLNALGTDEGSALATAIENFQQLTITMSEMKETIKELTKVLDTLGGQEDIFSFISNERLSQGLVAVQALSQAIGAIGSLAAANAKMQVAAIDRQIEAEKRLDGNSKASLAKIDAMEKKKTAVRRKAFEEDKKIKIAQAMIAGLTGAVMAYASLAWIPFVGPALGAAVAATIMSLTNKNISLIKASQFDGGGDAGGGSPQSISVGGRNNSVDVSRAVSGGELSYLRGEQGIGSNANNFTPGGAAGMRRGYQTGGGVLVGEQGPEVIQPMGGGFNVVPNERIGGQNLNANITINAVDAAGVEDVLMNQRGNIISMIREAAHEHGEEFIEGVNTASYTGGSDG